MDIREHYQIIFNTGIKRAKKKKKKKKKKREKINTLVIHDTHKSQIKIPVITLVLDRRYRDLQD